MDLVSKLRMRISGPLVSKIVATGAAHSVTDSLEQTKPLQVLRVAAVGEVEPGRVHSGADQGANHILAVHRGAQGADDLYFSHIDFLLWESNCSDFVHPYHTGKEGL